MVFSTIIFLCAFLPITIIGYYLMPGRAKNGFLLLCSLFFYAWGEPTYIFVMLFSILCNYVFGRALSGADRCRKLWLILTVAVNLGILCVFKYSGFLASNLNRILQGKLTVPEIALPIGISFYTFQGLSYCIDVYRDKGLVQKNPFRLALYISMFPQLVAGPIVRYADISESLTKRTHSAKLCAEGMERFIVGLSKKAILANTMGELADQIMGSDVSYMSASVAWIGAIAYTLQIYFDFSGYSDMAIGLGKIFGFHFPENFRYPYISKSVREFWRRWHISLSSWFRDYLYIPLGGSRRGNVYLHLFIVFLATGLWHGAAWGFVIWGLWHGAFVMLERAVSSLLPKEGKQNPALDFLGHAYTLLVVMVGWVLFELVDVGDTLRYLSVMFGLSGNSFVAYAPSYYLDARTAVLFAIAVLACLPWLPWLEKSRRQGVISRMMKRTAGTAAAAAEGRTLIGRRLLLLILLALSFVFIITSTYNPFIYFRF